MDEGYEKDSIKSFCEGGKTMSEPYTLGNITFSSDNIQEILLFEDVIDFITTLKKERDYFLSKLIEAGVPPYGKKTSKRKKKND